MVSIIIVQYKVKKELFSCITSIYASKPKTGFEIIVVDNDEKKTIMQDLLKEFSKVTYIPNENKGFGQGNNTGAQYAKGDFLFFLNPDTIIYKGAIDELVKFLGKNKKAGIVAPFLLHEDKKPFVQQGVKELNPFRAIFALSFINKLFPGNPVANKYFIQWDTIETKEVDVVPGTAFMISAKLYNAINGFDEHFFLYFEEFDLCKRVKEKGYKLFIDPGAKVIHLWERSTKHRNDINKIFNESRFYYFKKHFGVIPAILTNAILNFGKYSFFSLLILLLGAFLLFYKISDFMPFIGDQAWFYISARNMLLSGAIPLVGITSSHTWLHQGPLWTYLLASALYLGHFNPLSGAYLTISISLLTVWLIYKIGSIMLSLRAGIIASLFYATSPLIILIGRMPYHTSLIPVFTLLWFFVLYKWVNGYKYGFPLLLFLLAVLYNCELSMVMLLPILGIIFIYGIVKKTPWFKELKNYTIILLSIVGLVIPMIPMLLYDIHHGYPQTLKFGIWIAYKIANFFHIPLHHPDIPGETYQSMFHFASIQIADLLFVNSAFIAWLIALSLLINLILVTVGLCRKNKIIQVYSLLLLFFTLPFLFYIAERTNSDAYWPIFFPTIAFMFGILFDTLLTAKKYVYIVAGLLFIITVSNIWTLLQTNYLTYGDETTYADQIKYAKEIIRRAHGRNYYLIGEGTNSQYESFTMNYAYLTWWLGHGPSEKPQPLYFIIDDMQNGTVIYEKKNNVTTKLKENYD